MDFNVRKDYISVCETAFQGNAEHAVDCDITLPEYLPDIVRILRCSAVPGVQTHQITGDRITAECDCLVRVIYVCEQGKIHGYDQTLHFSKQIELKAADSITDVFVGAKTEYVNYRVSGQRKFEVHGAITVFARADAKKRCELICGAEGDGITARTENFEACDLVSLTEKTFTVSETCEAAALKEPISSVIHSGASAVIDEVKVISNKLFLKGELLVHTAFTSGEDCETGTLDNMISINQIIEAPDITEDCRTEASLSVLSLDVRSKFDSAGDKNLLEISATLGFSARGYATRTVTAVKDAYSVKYETEMKKAGIYVSRLEEQIEDAFLCRGTVDLSTTGMTEILSFVCSGITSAFSVRENCAAVNGEVTADIIYKDSKGEPAFAQRQIPYEYNRNMQTDGINLTCRPECAVTASSFVIGNADTLDVRIEINVQGFVFREEEKTVVTEIVVDKSRAKILKTASLTVYFADEGESLWNIAEKYNTTVDAIMRENRIPDGKLEKSCKLLIPKI